MDTLAVAKTLHTAGGQSACLTVALCCWLTSQCGCCAHTAAVRHLLSSKEAITRKTQVFCGADAFCQRFHVGRLQTHWPSRPLA